MGQNLDIDDFDDSSSNESNVDLSNESGSSVDRDIDFGIKNDSIVFDLGKKKGGEVVKIDFSKAAAPKQQSVSVGTDPLNT